MMSKAEEILKESNCLTNRQMRDYLNGNLDRKQAHVVELHLASCEFCSDALDGLSEMKSPKDLPVIMNQIRNRYHHHLHHRRKTTGRKKHYIRLVVIVFVILLLLLLAFFAIDFKIKEEHRLQPTSYQKAYPGAGVPSKRNAYALEVLAGLYPSK